MGKKTCPNCGETFQSIGVHWGKSSSCSHPRFSSMQRHILEALFMSGGTFIDIESKKNPSFRILTTDETLLRWISRQFPLLGRDVILKVTAEESAEQFYERLGTGAPNAEDSEASDVYEWETRSNPQIKSLYAEWTDDEGKRRVPETYNPSPLTLAVAYALCGRLDAHGAEATEFSATFPIISTAVPLDDWLYTLTEFEPSTHHQYERPLVILRDSDNFFETIRGLLPDATWIPTVRRSRKWPTEETPLTSVEPDATLCPTCGNRFNNIGMHWKEEKCSPPSFSHNQLEFLTGALLVSGSVMDRGTNRPRLIFSSTREEFATAVNEMLGILSTGVQHFEPSSSGREDVYKVQTRRHRALLPFEDWYDNGEKARVPNSIQRSPGLLRGMYARTGTFENETPLRESSQVALSLTQCPLSDERLKELFEPFDVKVRQLPHSRKVVSHDVTAFFDYIGREPVSGMEDMWPRRDSQKQERNHQ